MSDSGPVTVICRYVAKAGKQAELEALLGRHWSALRTLGLVTDTPARIYRGLPAKGPEGPDEPTRTYVEIFEWADARAPQVAHETPEVMAVWEPMGAACERMEFPHFEPLAP